MSTAGSRYKILLIPIQLVHVSIGLAFDIQDLINFHKNHCMRDSKSFDFDKCIEQIEAQRTLRHGKTSVSLMQKNADRMLA